MGNVYIKIVMYHSKYENLSENVYNDDHPENLILPNGIRRAIKNEDNIHGGVIYNNNKRIYNRDEYIKNYQQILDKSNDLYSQLDKKTKKFVDELSKTHRDKAMSFVNENGYDFTDNINNIPNDSYFYEVELSNNTISTRRKKSNDSIPYAYIPFYIITDNNDIEKKFNTYKEQFNSYIMEKHSTGGKRKSNRRKSNRRKSNRRKSKRRKSKRRSRR